MSVSPKGFGVPISNRTEWDALRANPSYNYLINNAKQYLTMTFPAWSDALYLDYSKTGNRGPGEAMIWNRHKWLAPLVWAECLENKGQYLPLIKKILAEYVKEPSWVLPAHDTNLDNFYKRRYEVDLSSSKFAHELAQTLYLLGGKLDATLYNQVYAELDKRIFSTTLTSLKTLTRNDWLIRQNNWNVVCLAGVTGAALTVVKDKNVRARFVAAAEKYSKNYVAGFYNDGFDPEGIGYHGYSMTNFITLREVVYQMTTKKVDFFTNPKVKNMALYSPRLMIQNNVWPTIADCRWATTAQDNVMWYVGRVFGIKLGAKYDTKSTFVSTSDISVGSLHAFPNSASTSPAPTTDNLVGIRTYFQDAGVIIVRPTSTGAAIGAAYNGGNNNESHNHNDIGSFTVVAGNQSMVGDPGGPTFYNGDVWGSARYTKYKQFSSYGHSLPVIAGKTQIAGATAVGKILSNKFTTNLDITEMDIKSAYSVAELKTLIRKFNFSRTGSGSFAVIDSFEYTKPMTFESAITTHATIQELPNNVLKFTLNSQTLYAQIEAGNNPFTYTYDYINELGLQFTRVGLKFTNPMLAGVVKITYSINPPQTSITKATITGTSNTFCDGGNSTLTANTGASYKWYNGTTLLTNTAKTYTATKSGSYTVEVTYSNGTKSVSAPYVITVKALPVATITAPASVFCVDTSLKLTSSTGASYKWYNGTALVGIASTYIAKVGGNYTVEVTGTNGCLQKSAVKTITRNDTCSSIPSATYTVTPSNNINYCMANGSTSIIQQNCNTSAATQKWILVKQGNSSFYTIKNQYTGDFLTYNSLAIGSRLNANNTSSILWKLEFAGVSTDGFDTYRIAPKDDLDLAVYNKTSTAINLFMGARADIDNQKFIIKKSTNVVTRIDESALEKIEEVSISCSPNPFKDEFTIKAKGEFSYTIYSSTGLEVASGNGENETLAGKNLSIGFYVVHVQYGTESKLFKVIKE